MIPWAAKKKLSLLLSALAGVVVVVIIIAIGLSYHPPSCHDNIKNQGEFGIDCGGPCQNLCKEQTVDPIVHWQRAFMVVPGVFNAVAYVENPNTNSAVTSAPYTFKLYDVDNLLITERSGAIFIPSKKTFAVFEATIQTGSRVPSRVTFNFGQDLDWQKSVSSEPEIRITDVALDKSSTLPLIKAKLTNTTFITVRNFEVDVIVYDSDGTAQAASKTIVDKLGPNMSSIVNFSWPSQFGFSVGKIELIPNLFAGLNF